MGLSLAGLIPPRHCDGRRSWHRWLSLCYARLGHLFLCLPKQPGYHKRLKAAAPLLAATIDHLAASARRGTTRCG